MHVLFVAPSFPKYQPQFVRALASVGAKVTGIGEGPVDSLTDDLKNWLDDYEQVSSVCNEEEMVETVKRIQQRGWVDRMEATIEAHVMAAARVREECGIPGLTTKQAWLCRDKSTMKEFAREHGIPCAQSIAASSVEEVVNFGKQVGYPLILKPRDGAGASSTWRVDRESELDQAMHDTGVIHGHSIAVEEFIEGHEGFYDTMTAGGNISHEFISHYYPNVLEAMRTRWISPVIIHTNRMDAPGYQQVKDLGRHMIRKMELDTAPTHMEWFFGDKGLKFSEIGARPPGVGHWDIYCAANDIDLYQEWASAVVHGSCPGTLSRNYSAAIINLRPTQDGHIQHYEGFDRIQEKYGEWIFKCHFPSPGSPTQPVEEGYMANAWIQIKFPDYDGLREILTDIGQTLKVIAS